MHKTCPDCGADAGTVGVIEHTLCETCLSREGITERRDFGVGVPVLIAEECYALRDLLHEKLGFGPRPNRESS